MCGVMIRVRGLSQTEDTYTNEYGKYTNQVHSKIHAIRVWGRRFGLWLVLGLGLLIWATVRVRIKIRLVRLRKSSYKPANKASTPIICTFKKNMYQPRHINVGQKQCA